MSDHLEAQVRDLLLSSERQPSLLDPQRVIAAGRRRVLRRRVALGVAAVTVVGAVLAGVPGAGVDLLRRSVQSVAPAAGAVQTVKVGDTTLGFAVRNLAGGATLIIYQRDRNGALVEEFRTPGIDESDTSIGMGTSQLPTMSFGVLPAGSHDVRAVFSAPEDHLVRTTTVQGEDHRLYVVVVVRASSYDAITRLRGYTWLDRDGHRQQDLPL